MLSRRINEDFSSGSLSSRLEWQIAHSAAFFGICSESREFPTCASATMATYKTHLLHAAQNIPVDADQATHFPGAACNRGCGKQNPQFSSYNVLSS
jgi:hypothetical protein